MPKEGGGAIGAKFQSMKTRRRSHTAAPPPPSSSQSLTVNPTVPASDTKRTNLPSLWDVHIPPELLREILSHLGLKSNIVASLVCKTWLEASVSVRRFQPHPWIFYEIERSLETGSSYILVNHPLPSNSHMISRIDLPDIIDYHTICCCLNGWLLMRRFENSSAFLLNPSTKNRIVLPDGLIYHDGNCFGFSAPPTSASCVVMECVHLSSSPVVINTWRPGETEWTVHKFQDRKRRRKWDKCVFANGVFYCLSTRGHIGVFDPYKVTWKILAVKPIPTFNTSAYIGPVLFAEHEGDIFVMFTRILKNPVLFRLNLERNVWEERSDLGGLTVFASHYAASLVIAGLSMEERNKIYRPDIEYGRQFRYISLVGGKGSGISSHCINWVEPPT